LLTSEGASCSEICSATGFSPDAITDIRRRWSIRGMRSLKDSPHPGRPRRVTAAYLRELRRALRRSPLAFGYGFTVWSIARLAAHLAKRTGIRICRDWLRRLVHQNGYRCNRPRHTLRQKRALHGSGAAYQRAKRQLKTLKKRPFCLRPATSYGTSTRASSTCIRTWRAAG
jgi:transposase